MTNPTYETVFLSSPSSSELQKNGYYLYPEHTQALQASHEAFLGAMNVIEALVLGVATEKFDPNSSEGQLFIQSRLIEIHDAVVKYHCMTSALLGPVQVFSTSQEREQQLQQVFLERIEEQAWLTIHMLFSQAMNEYYEQMNSASAQVVMIAGNQGSGKGEASKLLESKGFKPLAMSQIVREVVSAWGLDKRETIDKIIVGQIFKEQFGLEILVSLGVFQSLCQGQRKIAIDGPRVIAEAEAVLKIGGVLIGVVVDQDPETDKEIRRQRIVERASSDSSRLADVAKFDQREAIEAREINAILELATLIIINDSSVEEFGKKLEQDLESVL